MGVSAIEQPFSVLCGTIHSMAMALCIATSLGVVVPELADHAAFAPVHSLLSPAAWQVLACAATWGMHFFASPLNT
jgi:hypothetical protein